MNLYCNMFDTVGVIGPMIPSLFSVFGPIVLMAAFTFLVAIPRWFLMFAHWLWHRTAPQSLRDRTFPGIRSNTFQGIAVHQFTDEYSFTVPDHSDLKTRISNFFARHGAVPEKSGSGCIFSRGNRFCTYILPHLIPWRERDFLQTIAVETRKSLTGEIEVSVRYVVQALCMLRLQPAGLQDEVRILQDELA